MGRLDGKVALITGGAGGLGRQTAELFLNEGAKIALVDIDVLKLDKIRNELGGENIITIEADVTNESNVRHYVDQTVNEFDQIDIFFNNAGIIGEIGSIDEQALGNFNKV